MTRPPDAAAVAGLSGFRRYTWWSLQSGNAVFLLVSAALWGGFTWWPSWLEPVRWVLLIAVVVTLSPVLSALLGRPDGEGRRAVQPPRTWAVASAVSGGALGLVLLLGGDRGADGGGSDVWVIGPALVAAALVAFTPQRSWLRWYALAVGIAALTTAIVTLVMDGVPDTLAVLWAVGGLTFVFLMTLVQVWTWEVTARLDDARRVAAQLAVADERLRFAADLHDIQGHHLQVIALKAELAARLAPGDTVAAIGELEEIQRLATDAIRDTRAVVQGYRRSSLEEELTNAAAVLASAGIDGKHRVDPTVAPERLPEPTRHLLGLVVREATTNVLRHSDATRAQLDLDTDGTGSVRLVVRNDGAPVDGPVEPGGLAGLETRLRDAGGQLHWVRSEGRFALEASLPFAPEVPA